MVTIPRVVLEGLLWDNRRLYTRVQADSVWFQVRLDSLARRLGARHQRPEDEGGDIINKPVVFIGGFLLGAWVTVELADAFR